MYLLGYDMGSSFIKVSLVDANTFQPVDTEKAPEQEMPMISPEPGWAEQDPIVWWENAVAATKRLLSRTGVSASDIKSIGIGYQMHGLVIVGEYQKVLRPAIIWCDSRAVEIGNQAVEQFGAENFLSQTLNLPGNFTASKLKWVKDNEPEIYEKIEKIMLPGDYLAMRLTGEINTTVSGLSEMILWDFQGSCISQRVLEAYGIDKKLIPDVLQTFEAGGAVRLAAAQEMGLVEGIPVTYRAGDQPNNALSLGVLSAGEVAATGGTSGVIYGVLGEVASDPNNQVNAFAHVTHEAETPAIGLLLCLNGAGRAYSWLRQTLGLDYEDMEKLAADVPIGCEGLRIIPFGNGAERILGNTNVKSHVVGLEFNQHNNSHLARATLEGIAFAFVYGGLHLKNIGVDISLMRVGNDNLFQSEVFSRTIATLLNTQIDVVKTTGAVGAAIGSGVAVGLVRNLKEASRSTPLVKSYFPYETDYETYKKAYDTWCEDLERVRTS